MTAVDWSRPIEAVHEGFDPQAAVLDGDPDQDGDYTVSWGDKLRMYVRPTGEVYGLNWRIRNVQPTTPERDPALWDRMEALVRDMGETYRKADTPAELPTRNYDMRHYQEARNIQNLLPKPVDPDLIEARKLAAEVEDFPHGSLEDLALAAIKRGRQLAGEQA